MPNHVGHPSDAETALQEIVEDPAVDAMCRVRKCARFFADGVLTVEEQLALQTELHEIQWNLANIRFLGSEGHASVAAIRPAAMRRIEATP